MAREVLRQDTEEEVAMDREAGLLREAARALGVEEDTDRQEEVAWVPDRIEEDRKV